MRVAITGSSGLLGTALTERLAAGGHELLPVVRGDRADPASLWDPAAGWVRDGALDGVDAVVHLAGASIGEGRWTARRREQLRSSRIDTTRLLVEHLASLAASAGRPRALISASAVGLYGDRGDEELGEDAGAGAGFLAELVVAWEAEARRAEELGVRTVRLRMTPVLTRRGGALPRMLLPFRLGLGGRLGHGRQWQPWVSLADAVAVLERAVTDDSFEGAYNVASPVVTTNREFTRALGRALRRPAVLPMPAFALRALFGRGIAEELLLASQRAVPQRLTAAGYEFRHPDIDSALRAALDDERVTSP